MWPRPRLSLVAFQKSEYTYGADWDALHAGGTGPLTILEGDFSLDQKKKVYVQDKLAVHKRTLYDWIVKNNCMMCCCSSTSRPLLNLLCTPPH